MIPVGFAFTLWLLVRRRWRVPAFLRQDVPKGVVATIIALACFALWPLLDPDPRAVIDDFVLGENFGKVGSEGGYLAGLVSPTHGLHMSLLGPLLNAAFLAPPLVLLVVRDWKGRAALTPGEQGLWISVLAFVVFYTLPSHRQANYLLPVMPCLAVLLGIRWSGLSLRWLRLASMPLVVTAAGLLIFLGLLRFGQGEAALDVPAWLFLVPALAVVVALLSVHTRSLAPRLFHLGVFLVFLSIGAAAAPFEAPAGRFDEAAIQATAGETVHVASTFRSRHERHRFLLPEADVRGYWRKDTDAPRRLYDSGAVVALVGPLGESLVPADAELLGRRIDLRTRQTSDEIVDLLLNRNLDVLLQQEVIVRRRGTPGDGKR